MKENRYDDELFFEKYSQMPRSVKGLSGAGEWRELEKLLPDFRGKRVLDLGCGYGVIGITLKKQYPDSAFTLAEVNPRALELAQENAARNGAEVTCVCSDVYSGVEGNTFTDILTNPPIRAGKKVIYQMFEQAYDHLREGGRLWVVIRKQQGAASAREKIAQVFGSCEIISREKGYLVLLAKKVDKLTGD